MARRQAVISAPVGWLEIPVVLRDWRDESAARRHSALARLLGILASVIATSVLILLLVPLFVEFVFMARSTVAIVDGTKIETGVYAQVRDFRRFEIIRELNQLVQYRVEDVVTGSAHSQAIEQRINELSVSLSTADFEALEDLITVILLRKKSRQDALVVSPNDLEIEQESVLAKPRLPTLDIAGGVSVSLAMTPTNVNRDQKPLDERLKTLLNTLDMRKTILEELILTRALEHVYLRRAEQSVATVQSHVHLRQIIVKEREEANSYIERYRTGVSWDRLVYESINKGVPDAPPAVRFGNTAGYSDPTGTDKSDLGFVPRGILSSALEDVAFSLDVGDVSEPILLDGQFYVLLVAGTDLTRSVSSEHMLQLRRTAIADFRTQLRESAKVEYRLDSRKVDWATRHGLKNVGNLDPNLRIGAVAR